MQCIDPYFKQEEYKTEEGKYWRALPCGGCVACLANRRSDWTLRLTHELSSSTSAHFITLTYSDENIYYNENNVPSVYKPHLQNFIKRLRRKTDNKLRYYAIGEYGTQSLRPHYHVILFNLPNDRLYTIEDSWMDDQTIMGFTKTGTVTPGSIHYVTKYHVNKTHFPINGNKPFATMSRRPGIGHDYINKFTDYHQASIEHAHHTALGGIIQRLPRYYKDKLYTDEQKASMPSGMANPVDEFLDYNRTKNPISFTEYRKQQHQQLITSYRSKINREDKF